MTLNEFQKKPLSELLNEMDLIEIKAHTDKKGTIRAIEVKYSPKNSPNQETRKEELII